MRNVNPEYLCPVYRNLTPEWGHDAPDIDQDDPDGPLLRVPIRLWLRTWSAGDERAARAVRRTESGTASAIGVAWPPGPPNRVPAVLPTRAGGAGEMHLGDHRRSEFRH